jgi:hypothetical protein
VRFYLPFAHEAAGASAPGIPHALRAGSGWQNSDAMRREKEKACPAF